MKNKHASDLVLAVALATFACVAVSVVNVCLVLMTVWRWRRQFGNSGAPDPLLYSYTGMHGSFEDYNYRYRKLRHAVRRLLAAIAFLFLTVALSAA